MEAAACANTWGPSYGTRHVRQGRDRQERPPFLPPPDGPPGSGSGSADQLLVNLRQSHGISKQVVRKEGVWRDWEGRGK